jgi:hypothetical protein
MIKVPSISQYLISTCLYIIDELNEQYKSLTKAELKTIADTKFNEMDITVKIGYPFSHTAHYTVGDTVKRGLAKSNHDIYVESKDFKIEIKYLKNWKSASKTVSNSALWKKFQADFDWLFSEIDNGHREKRAFVIGWFNCVDYFTQLIQLGKGSGKSPLINEERVCYFPFLKKTVHPTHTRDLTYNYSLAYEEQPISLISKIQGNYKCIFIGTESDVFHFAVYY